MDRGRQVNEARVRLVVADVEGEGPELAVPPHHVELIVLPDKLRDSRDAGYAVGAGMKFFAGGDEPPAPDGGTP